MAADGSYTLFDLDADDSDEEKEDGREPEPPASEAEEEPGPPGKPDFSAIKVPIMDNVGHIGTPGGKAEFSVFRDSSYQGPTISGIGGPGVSNWTPERRRAHDLETSQRLQAEMALEEAVKQRDPMRCAAGLVQLEKLGMDTSTSTAQLACSIADPDYVNVLREAQRDKALEDELKEFAEEVEAGSLEELAEAGVAAGLGEWDGEAHWAADGAREDVLDDGPSKKLVGEDSPAASDLAVPKERPARRPPRRSKRRKSPSLAEKLLLGPNVPPPCSTSEEGEEEDEEAQEEWQVLPADPAAGEGDVAGDPDLQLVGTWQFGSKATERLRISRPARGFLLVDRQLPTGLRASGELRRGEETGVLQASLAVKDGDPAGAMRVRPVDARHVAVSLQPSEEAPWLADEVAEKATLWLCCPPEKRPIGIREVPEFDGQRTGSVLRPGEVFCASAEQPAPTGDVLWLRLSDGRGWVFDRQPGAASLCVRCDLPISGFSVLDGYMPPGGEIHFEEIGLEEAKIRCAALPDCQGFCFEGGPKVQGPVGIVFKNRWQHGGAGEGTGWTSVRVERSLSQAGGEAAGSLPKVAMTPAEEEDARRWYDSISQGWLTRLKPEGANEGGINALEDILASMDRCDRAEDPELEAVRTGLERTKEVGCTALTPLTREDQALVPTGKLTSCLRPYSAKEGDDLTEPNAAVGRLTGRSWVSEFRKHHPAARVSPGLALRALTGEDARDEAEGEDAEVVLPSGGGGGGALRRRSEDVPGGGGEASEDEATDKRGREAPWWEQQEPEVSEAPSLQDRAAHIAPVHHRAKARPKEKSKMAMPKARLLTAASSSSQARGGRSGIPLNAASSSSASAELGSDLSGLFSWS